MKNYRVLSRINHDNQSYESGETLGLNDRTAKPLLDCGVIEPMLESDADAKAKAEAAAKTKAK